MSRHVGESLDDDPVGRDLNSGRQRGQLGSRDGDGQMRPVVGPKCAGLLPQGSDEAEFVERGRAHPVDEGADVGDGGGRLGTQRGEQLFGTLGVAAEGVAGRVRRHRDP